MIVKEIPMPETKQTFTEEMQITGDKLLSTIKDLLHESNVRHIVIKNAESHTLAEFPGFRRRSGWPHSGSHPGRRRRPRRLRRRLQDCCNERRTPNAVGRRSRHCGGGRPRLRASCPTQSNTAANIVARASSWTRHCDALGSVVSSFPYG